MARQWTLTGQEGFEKSLQYSEGVNIPFVEQLKPNQVLVRMYAAALNYRELMIAGEPSPVGPIPYKPNVIPGCDGAGVVKAVGSSVSDFRPGDRVVTHAAGNVAETSGDDARAGVAETPHMLGCMTDGTLSSMAVFGEKFLVRAPDSLEWTAAAVLTVTWITAWNILFGVRGQEVQPESWVLVQGTGGVSVAALQLAAAAGCNIVATTSTAERETKLQSLGAAHTVNYRSKPETWGQEARGFTPNGRGFDVVVDVGGDETLAQSMAAVRTDGMVVLAGAVGGAAQPVPLMAAFMHTCMVRGVMDGSRSQLRALVRFIDEKGIKPAVDGKVFELAEAKEAYRRLQKKEHFAKVVLRIDHD